MSTIKHKSNCACVPGALPGGLVRTRFFDGMFLTQADLENEQIYWRMKRRLTNRALGDGVVWGLRVAWDARTGMFSLGPGYALDCCGNDLVVECAQTMRARDLLAQGDPSIQALCGPGTWQPQHCPDADGAKPQKACLVLQYVECPEEPAEVHRNACATQGESCEYSRVRETTRLLFVPPPSPRPPSPIDDFCARVEEIRKKFEGADEASNLFPDAPASLTEVPAVLPLFVEVAATNAPTAVQLRPTVGSGVADSGPTGSVSAPFAAVEPVVHLSIVPEAGWGLYDGRIETESGDQLQRVVPPLPGSLLWTMDVDAAGLPDGASSQVATFLAKDVVVMPILGDARLRMNLRIVVFADLLKRSEVVNISYKATVEIVGAVTVEPVGEEDPSCCRALENLIFVDNPACTVKTLVLVFLYSWLRCLQERGNGKGLQEVSRVIYLVAWRLLFGANAGATSRRVLEQLLEELLQALCQGLMYPGPRCQDEHHGVYLGCAEIVDGRIVKFDPWSNRRYVLTGPLLNHWGEQFGLAPVDVVVGRIARTLCCLSAPAEAPSVEEFSDVSVGSLFHGTVGHTNLGRGGRLHFGNAIVFLGNGFDIVDAVKKTRYRSIRREKLVSVVAMQDLIARGMTRNTAVNASNAGVVYSLPSANIHILLPDDENVQSSGESMYAVRVDELPPLARKPVADVVVNILNTIPLGSVKSKGRDKVMPELLAASIHSVGDLLHTGPERAADIVGTASAKLQALNDLYEVAEKLEANAVDAARVEVKKHKGPFLRESVANKEFIKAMASNIAKGSEYTPAEISDVVARAAARAARTETVMPK